MQRHLLLFLIPLMVGSWSLLPESGCAQTALTNFDFIRPKQKKVVIPFEFHQNLIIIPMRINDSDTLRFILDSGVNSVLITQLSLRDSLTLMDFRRTYLRGLGAGNPVPAVQTFGNQVFLKGLQGTDVYILFLEEMAFQLSETVGTEVHGLIGYQLFREFVVEIDYQNHELHLHRPDTYRNKGKWETVPMTLEDGKPYITATVGGPEGEYSLKLLVDLGASFALSLYAFREGVPAIPNPAIRTFIGSGLNGEVHGFLGKMNSIVLGKYQLEDPMVNFPDEASVAASLGSDRKGIIGSEVFRRFRVVFDYPNNRMLLRSNQAINEPFPFNRSGIDLRMPHPNLPIFLVYQVREGSPADLAGVKINDRLVSVNGYRVEKLQLDRVTRLLRGKPGKTQRLEIIREGEYQTLKLDMVDPFIP